MFDTTESLWPYEASICKKNSDNKNNRHFLDLGTKKLQKMPKINFGQSLVDG